MIGAELLAAVKRAGGHGFVSGDKLYLQRCPACHLENWSPAVASGQCAWCGWDTNRALAQSADAQQGGGGAE